MYLRYFKLIFCVILGLFLTISCQVNFPEKTDTNVKSNFKVAILLPEFINEGSWSPSGYQGLKLIEKELNAEIAYTEDINHKSIPEITAIFRNYAKQNYDLIIGHGSEDLTLPAASIVATEFPRINFAITGNCSGNNANLGCIDFRRDEISYLMGVVAALKSQTGKIAFLGGFPYPTLTEESNAIPKGAKSINPDIQVNINWLNSWTDEKKALEMAQKQLDLGVDLLILHGDPATSVVHKLAEKKGVWTIAWNLDQNELAPQTVITSAILKVPELLLKTAILVQEGHWQGQQYKFGFLKNVQELAPFRNNLTPEAESKVEKIKQDILTGRINV
jgi:basic membrane protein A and related proteins